MSDPLREAKERFIAECRRVIPFFGQPEWMTTDSQSDDDHVSDFSLMLNDTREDHNPSEKTEMHYVRDSVTGRTLAIVGNTDDASERARGLTGILRSLPAILDSWMRAEERVNELLESNNEKLTEVRTLRAKVRALEDRQKWLIDHIPLNEDEAGDF